MKLLRTTQFHTLGLEIVLHYVAFIYEIRSHFKFLFFNKSYSIIYIYYKLYLIYIYTLISILKSDTISYTWSGNCVTLCRIYIQN